MESPPPKRRWKLPNRNQIVWVFGVVVILLALGVPFNVYGRNISGTVACASGARPVGVFVQAERVPRMWQDGPELNSGFATLALVTDRKTNDSVYRYVFWLRFDGRASIHLGCGTTSGGTWSSDNWSEYYDGDVINLVCNDPPPDDGPTMITFNRCRRL